MVKHRPSAKILAERTPGEKAFDACFLPLAALTVGGIPIGVVVQKLLARNEASSEGSMPGWYVWVQFAIGAILTVFWLRAVFTLMRFWGDPSSRILRFPALVVLVPLGLAAFQLLTGIKS